MQSFEWVDATKLSDALSSLNDKTIIKAGGIDVLDRLKEGLDSPTRLVNIRNIRELKFAVDATGGLRLGPLMTLTETAQHPLVKQRFPALAEACAMAATPQIRNVATIGGNILQRPRCWYFREEQFNCLRKGGDKCFAQDGENDYHAVFDNSLCAIVHPSAVAVAAVAYGAIVQLTSSKGKREVPLESIFVRPEQDVTREHSLAPGELLTEIRLPARAAGARSAYTKLMQKESFDWPAAEVAVVLGLNAGQVQKASIILGAAAPIPWRAKEAEAQLIGKPLTPESASQAARAAVQGATPLRDNGYKLRLLEVAVRRTLLKAGASHA
jgi:xanthine dehydrogenase YagS FAD-binding subunit